MKFLVDKEKVYDEQIAPLVRQVIQIAKDNGIEMFMNFHIPNLKDTDLGVTTSFPGDSGHFTVLGEQLNAIVFNTRSMDGKRTELADGTVMYSSYDDEGNPFIGGNNV